MVWNYYWGRNNIVIIMIRNKRVVDAFLFFNEVDMALFRMEMLNADVDVFVVVEAKHTFTGEDKPLHFFDNRHKFKKFKHKIVYRVFRGGNSKLAWDNEIAQRNYIEKIFSKICFDDDLICISDVDEIPNIKSIKPNHEFDKPCAFMMDLYRYSWKYRLGENIWMGTKMMFYNAFKLMFKSIQDLRAINFEKCCIIKKGGWHLTYFGGVENIQYKLKSFSHVELNTPEFNNEDNITKSIRTGRDLFKRPCIIEHVDYEETGLPMKLKYLL